jgi:hypothetical protein
MQISCRGNKGTSGPETYFSENQIKAILLQLVIKTGKMPEGLKAKNEIEAFYQNEAMTYYWHYAFEKDGKYFFFISRPAPSLYGKRIGIAGSFISQDGISIRNYSESFRTFKLRPDELERKGSFLFPKLINGEDLSGYQPGGKDSKGQEWIEFPDAQNYYDSGSQKWETRPIPDLP